MPKVRKRILPSGEIRWLADYFDAAGTRRARQFSKRREAEDYLLTVRGDMKRGVHVAPRASITIAEAGELWVERAKRDGLERSTVRQYRQHLGLHITPLIGELKLSEFTGPMAHQFCDRLLGSRSKPMARKVMTSLGSIFEEAMKRGLAAYNPAAAVKVTRGRVQTEVEMPSKSELRAILNAATGRWRPLIIAAVFTGMRSSELRGLTWNHVDFAAGVIRVRQRADAWRKFGPPKSKAGKRDIPMAPLVVNTLKQWKLACPKGDGNPLGLVFPSPCGRVLAHACILKDGFGPIQLAAGVTNRSKPKYGLHALRHAAASLFIEQGMSPKRVQAIMGHASIRMTFDVYGYLFPGEGDDQVAMAQIEARLLKS